MERRAGGLRDVPRSVGAGGAASRRRQGRPVRCRTPTRSGRAARSRRVPQRRSAQFGATLRAAGRRARIRRAGERRVQASINQQRDVPDCGEQRPTRQHATITNSEGRTSGTVQPLGKQRGAMSATRPAATETAIRRGGPMSFRRPMATTPSVSASDHDLPAAFATEVQIRKPISVRDVEFHQANQIFQSRSA